MVDVWSSGVTRLDGDPKQCVNEPFSYAFFCPRGEQAVYEAAAAHIEERANVRIAIAQKDGILSFQASRDDDAETTAAIFVLFCGLTESGPQAYDDILPRERDPCSIVRYGRLTDHAFERWPTVLSAQDVALLFRLFGEPRWYSESLSREVAIDGRWQCLFVPFSGCSSGEPERFIMNAFKNGNDATCDVISGDEIYGAGAHLISDNGKCTMKLSLAAVCFLRFLLKSRSSINEFFS